MHFAAWRAHLSGISGGNMAGPRSISMVDKSRYAAQCTTVMYICWLWQLPCTAKVQKSYAGSGKLSNQQTYFSVNGPFVPSWLGLICLCFLFLTSFFVKIMKEKLYSTQGLCKHQWCRLYPALTCTYYISRIKGTNLPLRRSLPDQERTKGSLTGKVYHSENWRFLKMKVRNIKTISIKQHCSKYFYNHIPI